jgi:hypothetical protein
MRQCKINRQASILARFLISSSYREQRLVLSGKSIEIVNHEFVARRQEVGHDVYISARVFAYLMGLKEPRFVLGYGGPEMDIALMRGEIDARAASSETLTVRNTEWIEKKLVDLHAIVEVPKGDKPAAFARLPELETFATSERERKLVSMYRTFRLVGTPYIVPPGTPKAQVQILRDAMRKAYQDPDFHKEFKKLTGFDASPIVPEEMEKAIRELPREKEIVELFKKLSNADPMPPRYAGGYSRFNVPGSTFQLVSGP